VRAAVQVYTVEMAGLEAAEEAAEQPAILGHVREGPAGTLEGPAGQ